MKRFKWFLLLAGVGVLVLLDQVTKKLAEIFLWKQEDIPIIKGVFELSYVENRGAAFGMLQDKRVLFLLLTAVAVAVLLWLFSRIPLKKRFLPLHLAVGFLVSGAVGNLIDRAMNGYVIDFLYFKLIDFPVFNVADIYVTVSCGVLIVLLLFFYKEEDLQQIFSGKKKRGKSFE